MIEEFPTPNGNIVEAIATLYRASTQYADLRASINEIYVCSVSEISEEQKDAVRDLVQSNVFGFIMEVGGLLHRNFAFDPFLNFNIPSALCTPTVAPFAVTLMFGGTDEDTIAEDIVSIAIQFCLVVNEGRLSLVCG